MNDAQYLQYCRKLLAGFAQDLWSRVDSLPEEDPLRVLAGEFGVLCEDGGDLYSQGPGLVSRLFTGFPDFAPIFPRDLLWFFGGECLHYMPDTEIEQYQQLEHQRLDAAARGETLDMRSARANLLKLQ
jgi:hypothetical protein